MIRVPLEKPQHLERGVAYSIELHGTPEDGYAVIRPWQPSDVAAPITLTEDFTADYLDLKEWPAHGEARGV